jgi:hypothetical protein
MFCDFVQFVCSVVSFPVLNDSREWETAYDIKFLLGTDYSLSNEFKIFCNWK